MAQLVLGKGGAPLYEEGRRLTGKSERLARRREELNGDNGAFTPAKAAV